MRQDPYRRPGSLPVETKPRGVVVRRADEPEDLEAAEDRRRQAALRKRSILAAAEHDEAQRRLDLGVRRAGASMLALGGVGGVALLALNTDLDQIPSLVGLTSAMVLSGAWVLIVGAQKAVTIESIPSWVTTGATIAFAIGLAWGAS